MSEIKDLNQLENKLNATYHQDGIVDLMMAFGMMIFGWFALTDTSWLGGLVILPFLLYNPLKQKITVPRMGFVRFDAEKEAARRRLMSASFFASMLLGVVMFVLFTDVVSGTWVDAIRGNMPLVFGLVVAGICSTVAYAFKIDRLYVYAPLIFGVIAILHFTGGDLGLGMLIAGLVMMIGGSFVLIRFLRAYPAQREV